MYVLSRNYRVVLATLNAACWLVCAVPVSHADDGFVKDVFSACAVFKPNLRAEEAVVWKGPCANGNAEGRGVARWSANDGTTVTFEGKFSQGKLQGVGTMYASGGDRFEGSYKDGKRDGRGVYVSANGDRFEGEYKENQRHGQGALFLASGNRIVGEWRNGTQIATASNMPSSTAVAGNPIITHPQQLSREHDRQSQLAQRAAQEPTARELREQQRTEEQQRRQLAAQQRTQERERQQYVAQQAAQERQRQLQLAKQTAQGEQRQRQLAQQNAMEQQRLQGLMVLWALLAIPIAAAASVAFFKSSAAVSISNKTCEWIGSRKERAGEKTGLFAEFFLCPVLWCFQKLFAVTESIANPFIQAGVRIATWLYLAGLILFLIYWVTVIVLAVAMLIAGFWLLGAILSLSDSSSSSRPVRSWQPSDSFPSSGGDGESRQREGLFGKYIERTDTAGNVVGESRQREGFLGPYVEHQNSTGSVVAESRYRKGFLGDYVEHQDAEGNVVGESRQREGFLGPYTEHQNAEGKVVGESRQRDGLFGTYTEHKKSG